MADNSLAPTLTLFFGTINADGTVRSSSGAPAFTVEKIEGTQGIYYIYFDNHISTSLPTVTVSIIASSSESSLLENVSISGLSNNSFYVYTGDLEGNKSDQAFSFIAYTFTGGDTPSPTN